MESVCAVCGKVLPRQSSARRPRLICRDCKPRGLAPVDVFHPTTEARVRRALLMEIGSLLNAPYSRVTLKGGDAENALVCDIQPDGSVAHRYKWPLKVRHSVPAHFVVAAYLVHQAWPVGPPAPPLWHFNGEEQPHRLLRMVSRFGTSPLYGEVRWCQGGVYEHSVQGLGHHHSEDDYKQARAALGHIWRLKKRGRPRLEEHLEKDEETVAMMNTYRKVKDGDPDLSDEVIARHHLKISPSQLKRRLRIARRTAASTAAARE